MTKNTTNLFKTTILLLLILFLIQGCQEDFAKSTDKKQLKTVSIAEATALLQTEIAKNGEVRTRAGGGGLWAIPDLGAIAHEDLVNSEEKMTVIPVVEQPDEGYSRILLFEENGEIIKTILTFYKKKNDSGDLFLRELNGRFRTGYKVENGYIVAQYVRKDEVKTRGSAQNPYNIPEVIVVARRTYQYSYSLPIYCFYSSGGSGGGGSSGSTEDYGNHSLNNINDPGNKAKPTPVPPTTDSTNTPAYKFNLEEEIGMDENFKDSRANCIKQALEAGGDNSLLNKLLEGFKLENSPIDLIYKVKDKVFNEKGDEVNGLCERVKYSNNSIAITIYLSKTRMQTHSFLATARTILHETLHAHLHGMINAKDNTTFNTIPDADGLNFKDTWKKYIELHPEEKQHNWMAEKYIGLMKEGLSKLYEQWDDATKIRFEEYAGVTDANRDFMFECIAWHGLLGENHDMTEAGKEFYTKKGEEYEKMKDEVIRYLGKNCPTEK